MKMRIILKSMRLLTCALGIFFLASCSSDDDFTPSTPMNPDNMTPDPDTEDAVTETASKTYVLGSVDVDDISGTARFATFSNDSTVIELKLDNTPDGGMHPAHIHFNTAAEGGDIALSLAIVDGGTGESSTPITALDDGTAITYEQLLDFDGYINVHLSADELGTIVGQGDIGQNELTGTSKEYVLESADVPEIDGTATFFERLNGEALAIIQLTNTPADGMHPGHIHQNTAAEGGDIAFTFNPVMGATGTSRTNVAALDDETAFGYSDILDFDGYINIHLSADELGTIVAQGDIGQNELTGTSKEYTLNSVDVPTIDGTATFFERVNGEALAIVMLNGTMDGGIHPGHIHANSAAEGGGILFTFNPVVGATGTSKTNVAALDDETAFGYADVLTVDGYINIHLSAQELGTIVAQGDIGSNEGSTDSQESKDFVVTNNGASSYIFNSADVENLENPDLTLKRGETYTFAVDASGHPFFIKSEQGNTNANTYNTGVTNNGAQDATITFVVPMDAPDTLFYNCQFHSSMTGTFNIVD